MVNYGTVSVGPSLLSVLGRRLVHEQEYLYDNRESISSQWVSHCFKLSLDGGTSRTTLVRIARFPILQNLELLPTWLLCITQGTASQFWFSFIHAYLFF